MTANLDDHLKNGPDSSAEEERWELCHECGGLCCCLYLAHDEDGEYVGDDWLPDYIETWLERFVSSGALDRRGELYVAGVPGVAPLHDPRLSHRPDAEGTRYRAALPSSVDVRKCQFCDAETGCLLPRQYRAEICREWVCEIWLAEDQAP